MKRRPVLAYSLIAFLAFHAAHPQQPSATPPDEHIELPQSPDPIPRGRVTEWVTSTSTVAPATSIADMSAMFRSLK